MDIVLFGANGAIGRIVTRHALDHGDKVIAVVRRIESVASASENVTVVAGDLSDQSLLDSVIADADVVISTLGPPLDVSRRNTGTPIADGHEKILCAMEKHHKRRFITLGTPSIHSEDDSRQLWTILPAIMARLLFPNGYREMKKIERLITGSSLDWTVVRIINPNAEHTSNHYGVSCGDRPVKMSVSRENVGAFIYRVASENSYVRKMPIVFN